MGYEAAIDRRVYGPFETSLADPLALFLSKLGSLSDNHVITIGTAVNLHYGATLLFERDISAAYVLLVAGIETLSRTYGSPPDRWEEWDQSQNWNKWMEEQEYWTPPEPR